MTEQGPETNQPLISESTHDTDTNIEKELSGLKIPEDFNKNNTCPQDTPFIRQKLDFTCWAATGAMVASRLTDKKISEFQVVKDGILSGYIGTGNISKFVDKVSKKYDLDFDIKENANLQDIVDNLNENKSVIAGVNLGIGHAGVVTNIFRDDKNKWQVSGMDPARADGENFTIPAKEFSKVWDRKSTAFVSKKE